MLVTRATAILHCKTFINFASWLDILRRVDDVKTAAVPFPGNLYCIHSGEENVHDVFYGS